MKRIRLSTNACGLGFKAYRMETKEKVRIECGHARIDIELCPADHRANPNITVYSSDPHHIESWCVTPKEMHVYVMKKDQPHIYEIKPLTQHKSQA